jgi:hypothetical protein
MAVLFPSGIVLTTTEDSCLLHMVPDVEAWVHSTIAGKARLRRDALIEEWRPRLYADESVAELPANPDDLAAFILARDDYQTRAQRDAASDPVELISTHARDKYAAVTRSGSTVTLFGSGINLADLTANCILAYVQNLEEWAIGAVLGMSNRGKKTMIAQYHPIIMADSSVTTMPATEDGLIAMILARADYRRLGG